MSGRVQLLREKFVTNLRVWFSYKTIRSFSKLNLCIPFRKSKFGVNLYTSSIATGGFPRASLNFECTYWIALLEGQEQLLPKLPKLPS